jgi:beta-1,4-mannosyl-glycoprotein beta-1,4-N-acetylglucosaminyltransferase
MIYDCFTFFNELDILDIRLHELDKIVDKFVLVENTVTLTNKKKPLFYAENAGRFKQFAKKIIHVVVDDSPNVTGNTWIIEMHQFNAITRGLSQCKQDDEIILANVDEIPKPDAITLAKNLPGKVKAFDQYLYYYFLNLKAICQPWLACRMIKYSDLKFYQNPYVIRHAPIDKIVADGGWHFSFMGGVEKIREKIFAYTHQEYNNPKFNTPEKIKMALLTRRDIFNRDLHFEVTPIADLPEYVKFDLDKFSPFITPETTNNNPLIIPYLQAKDKLKSVFRKIRN